ncbi:MAG TPA: metallophosphoesterase family protein [Thermoleophilaceae bacterium]|jgi:predicted phosphodiesterase
MRYGVVSDVHGNLHALETVLAALERAGAERILCPGDIVGYGPRPNECAARLREAGAMAVAGNHDLMAVGRLEARRLGPLVARTIEWTRSALDDDARAYLNELPERASTGDGIALAHGSLDDPTEYVRDCVSGTVQLTRLRELEPGAAGLLLGHTHRPLACGPDGPLPAHDRLALPDGDPPPRWLLNPGSAGQSRERRPWARTMLLDTGAREATFLTLDYDVNATRAELHAAGLPPHAHHIRPGRWARALRSLRSRER